jgi:hypothetical protein
MPTISGTVLDDAGDPVAGRVVRAYRRDTGALLAEAVTSTGSDPTDADFASVSLLLHMDGANGSTTFTDSSATPKTLTRFGNTQISTVQSRFGGSSALFDGTGDYLSVPGSAAFNLGASNFTIELWCYFSVLGTDCFVLDARGNSANNCAAFMLVKTASNALAFYADAANGGAGDGAWTLTLTSAAVSGATWHHIAITRSGNVFTMYLNGVATATNTVSFTVGNSGNNVYIGAGCIGPGSIGGAFNGYIDELRITKGVARYTANFTPPTEPFFPPIPTDPNYSSVSLLLPMDGANASTVFVDRSPVTKTVTVAGNAQISTLKSKFGGASAYFDGNGDYLALNNSAFAFGTAFFTVEAWVNFNAFPGSGDYRGICGTYDTLNSAGTNCWYFMFNNNGGTVELVAGNFGLSGVASASSGVTFNTGTWYHLAAVRDSTGVRLFINGVEPTYRVFTAFTGVNLTQTQFSVGHAAGNKYSDCYIDDLRITTGVARYTTNFTPPGQLFRNTKEVKLTTGGYLLPVSTLNEVSVVCADDVPNPYRNDLVKRVFPQ